MESKYQILYDKRREELGLLDPEKVNEAEKSKYQLLYEQRQREKKEQEQTFQATAWGKTIYSAFSNMPKDSYELVKEQIEGIRTIFQHPVITGKEMTKLAGGVLSEAVNASISSEHAAFSALTGKKTKYEQEPLRYMKLFEEELFKKYGTEENFKKYFSEHPAHVLYDMTTMLLPVAKMLKLDPKIIRALSMGDPVNLAAQITKVTPTTLIKLAGGERMSKSLMIRALKLSEQIPIERQDEIVAAALKSELLVSMKSLKKANDAIWGINDAIRRKVEKHKWDRPLNIDDIFKSDTWKEAQLELLRTVSSSDVKKIFDDIEELYKKNIENYNQLAFELKGRIPRNWLDAVEVQDRKVRLNKDLDNVMYQIQSGLETAPMRQEAENALRKIYKEHIESFLPPLRMLEHDKITNKMIKRYYPKAPELSAKQIQLLERDLIDVKKALTSLIKSHRAGSLFPFQVISKQATGAAVGYGAATLTGIGDPAKLAAAGGLFGTVLGGIDSSSYLKSRVARFVKRMNRYGINVRPTGLFIRMGGYTAGEYVQYNNPELPETVEKTVRRVKGGVMQGIGSAKNFLLNEFGLVEPKPKPEN